MRPALVAVLFILFSAAQAKAQSTPGSVALGAKDSGRLIQLHLGDSLLMTLEENISTGYSWTFQGPRSGMSLHEKQIPGAQMPGSAGQKQYRLRFERSGRFELKWVYKRPWEHEAAKTVRLRVEVKKFK